MAGLENLEKEAFIAAAGRAALSGIRRFGKMIGGSKEGFGTNLRKALDPTYKKSSGLERLGGVMGSGEIITTPMTSGSIINRKAMEGSNSIKKTKYFSGGLAKESGIMAAGKMFSKSKGPLSLGGTSSMSSGFKPIAKTPSFSMKKTTQTSFAPKIVSSQSKI